MNTNAAALIRKDTRILLEMQHKPCQPKFQISCCQSALIDVGSDPTAILCLKDYF